MNVQIKNALVVSREFHPGHYSHLAANFHLFAENGISAFMYHHPDFNAMNVVDPERVYNRYCELKKIQKIDIAVFWFPSLKNFRDMLSLRFHHRARIVYVLHEPFESFRAYRQAGFSYKRACRIMLVHIASYLMVWLADRIILPSTRALGAFERHYRHTGKKHAVIPLLFDDEGEEDSNGRGVRRFISYIGTIADDHAFDHFLEFACAACNERWFPEFEFLIATRSELSAADREKIKPFVDSGAIRLVAGRPMSNDDINSYYRSSLIIWNAYRRSMQSGVLPKAYMFGTPLLVSSASSSEYFVDRLHGRKIEIGCNPIEIRSALVDVINNFEKLSRACRAMFINTFYYRAQMENFLRLVSE